MMVDSETLWCISWKSRFEFLQPKKAMGSHLSSPLVPLLPHPEGPPLGCRGGGGCNLEIDP